MKKILKFLFVITLTVLISACTSKKESDGELFKKDYESLNGIVNSSGKEHRSLSIDADNPFIISNASEIVDKIKKGDTFYVYFGSKLCPWCRSVIEKAIEVAKEKNINTIYYVDIWDDSGNEILRDKLTLNSSNEIETVFEGTTEYKELLKYFDSYLREYTLTDSEGNTISTGEKRIYAPNFMYIEDGKIKDLTTGKSDKQKDSREKLTTEMLEDEEEAFKKFFK